MTGTRLQSKVFAYAERFQDWAGSYRLITRVTGPLADGLVATRFLLALYTILENLENIDDYPVWK